jgi:DNA adenine methylase
MSAKSKPLKSIAPYYGGKQGPAGDMVAHIANTTPHRFWAELCGGVMSVTMKKRPCHQEVYNDVNSNLFALFSVVRDSAKLKVLSEFLQWVPFSRDEFNQSRNKLRNPETSEIERAASTLTLLHLSYLGSLGNKAFSPGGPKAENNSGLAWHRAKELLNLIHGRVKNLII